MKLPLVCGIFVSLSLAATEAPARPGPQAPASAAKPRLQVSTLTPRPGDAVLVTVTGLARKPRGTGGRVPLVFFPVAQGWQAVFAVPLARAPARIKVKVGGLGETLTVRDHTFEEEPVTIAAELAAPPPDKRQQIAADNAAVLQAVKTTSPPLFRGAFQMPGKGRQTSSFGSWRTFNGEHRSRHLGLDIGARKKTSVRAVQRGKVTLVRDGFLTGGAVVLTHGAGIASAYFHLSDIAVAVGDQVEPGQALGKVGLTGRTTGPHIHLGIWVPGGFVDPATFLRLDIAAPTVTEPAASAKVSQPAGQPADRRR